MRIFVAGASGAIGRPLIGRLIDGGHQVTGMTRREERAAEIRDRGAGCIVCDAFDRGALTRIVCETQPEVVVHELTALPPDLDPRKKGIYAANNRIRREGTRNLIAAAGEAQARRIVAQSIAFIYAPTGGWVKSEDDPVMSGAPGEFGEGVEATLDLERQVIGADGLDGLVLRYGFFYGPNTSYAANGYQAELVRKRRFPIVGSGGGTFSFVHVDDAAAATVAACERGAPGIYNVTDDEPAPVRDWLPALAEAVGGRRPRHMPGFLGRLLLGPAFYTMMTDLRGASNAKAKRELGWTPAFPSYRQGFAAL